MCFFSFLCGSHTLSRRRRSLSVPGLPDFLRHTLIHILNVSWWCSGSVRSLDATTWVQFSVRTWNLFYTFFSYTFFFNYYYMTEYTKQFNISQDFLRKGAFSKLLTCSVINTFNCLHLQEMFFMHIYQQHRKSFGLKAVCLSKFQDKSFTVFE